MAAGYRRVRRDLRQHVVAGEHELVELDAKLVRRVSRRIVIGQSVVVQTVGDRTVNGKGQCPAVMLLHPLNGLGILEGLETAHLLAPAHLPFPAVFQQQAAVNLVGPQLRAAGPDHAEAAAIVVHVSVGNDDALY